MGRDPCLSGRRGSVAQPMLGRAIGRDPGQYGPGRPQRFTEWLQPTDGVRYEARQFATAARIALTAGVAIVGISKNTVAKLLAYGGPTLFRFKHVLLITERAIDGRDLLVARTTPDVRCHTP